MITLTKVAGGFAVAGIGLILADIWPQSRIAFIRFITHKR